MKVLISFEKLLTPNLTVCIMNIFFFFFKVVHSIQVSEGVQ